MSEAPKDIEALIDLMARLPGLGPRSARRAVLHLIKKRGQVMTPLAQAMQAVAARSLALRRGEKPCSSMEAQPRTRVESGRRLKLKVL